MPNPNSLVFTYSVTYTGEIDCTETSTWGTEVVFEPEPASDESLFELLIAVSLSNRRPDFADEFRRRALETKPRAIADEPDPTPVIREIRP